MHIGSGLVMSHWIVEMTVTASERHQAERGYIEQVAQVRVTHNWTILLNNTYAGVCLVIVKATAVVTRYSDECQSGREFFAQATV